MHADPTVTRPAAAGPEVPRSVADLTALIGRELGPTRWVEVGQDRVDAFAEVTGDRQWIHLDVERAALDRGLLGCWAARPVGCGRRFSGSGACHSCCAAAHAHPQTPLTAPAV